MKRLFLLVALLALVSQASAAELPNIVILYADDMGYGDLGADNPKSKIPTPNLDRLASEGMCFTDAHSSSGICTPSRYALLTGRFHWRKFHGIVNAFDGPVLDDELTIPELLKEKGYRTACIGKWHLGWNWDDIRKPEVKPEKDQRGRTFYPPAAFDWSKSISGGPLSHGFDYYFGDDVPNFPPYSWFENDRVITEPTEPLQITPETAEGSWEARPGPMTKGWDFYAVVPRLTERTVDWIGEQKGKEGPFFLYVPFNSPHAPIVPTEEFRGKSQAGGFGDYVVQTDDNAGRILKALDDNGFGENTLVIFSADNGAEHYAYERVRKFDHWSSAPFRGVKRDLYEGGHHVPMIVKWPGHVPAGTVNDTLISQVDVMGSVASIVGLSLPANAAADSYDMSKVWTENGKGPRQSIVHNTMAGKFAIRDGDWLLVAAKTGAHSKVPAWFDKERGYLEDDADGELYNLKLDVAQKHNLYADHPEKVKELTALMKRTQAKGQVRQ
ncbi:arylsulfatase [Blastopirellula sp. JC732]|uniref:Arylsulfatase n=1 Tax=Blastopirellula sediminis TaxID=2894196 RepID=A0A9X1SHS6_9BACT|nr:arylsulfatase [Blastopirellula sediminis]MCC9606571.1 arylsulfatase [Blastopirellula sediminis]MCC9630131.1 arylsulfatase [Blastopirellula sediminis]